MLRDNPPIPAKPMGIQTLPVAPPDLAPPHSPANPDAQLKTLGSLGSLKWGLGKFGHGDKVHSLPPAEEIITPSNSKPSLKRSSSADNRSIEIPTPQEVDPKKLKKEAERMAKEAEKQKRALAQKMQREQARAVMQKRGALLPPITPDLEWMYPVNPNASNHLKADKQMGNVIGRLRRTQGSHPERVDERRSRARRRDSDDDYSASSSDLEGMSVISFTTVDSDPGPVRLGSSQGNPSSPLLSPYRPPGSPKSTVNPIFKVVRLTVYKPEFQV